MKMAMRFSEPMRIRFRNPPFGLCYLTLRCTAAVGAPKCGSNHGVREVKLLHSHSSLEFRSETNERKLPWARPWTGTSVESAQPDVCQKPPRSQRCSG